jgi:octaprenyl-diphosphate synthase
MQFFTAAKKELLPTDAARRIFGLIREEMSLVEVEFERQVDSNVQVINYLGDYLRSSGGKRVRPALVVLATYGAGGTGNSESVLRLATVMEMLHTATLVHDDIIDNAGLRRNRTSINARFGNQTAVLMGDWLYMSAFEASLKQRSLEILDILTRLTRNMTEGELIQLTMIGKADISEDEYFDIVRRKTAYLFAACCEIGAILARADLKTQTGLSDFGLNLGIAFQLADDLLDFTADESAIGKAAGADLLEGKVTLPLILLQKRDPEVAGMLRTVMLEGVFDEGTKAVVAGKMKAYGVLEEVRDRAGKFAEQARKNLEVLPVSEYSLALDAIPSYVIERNS